MFYVSVVVDKYVWNCVKRYYNVRDIRLHDMMRTVKWHDNARSAVKFRCSYDIKMVILAHKPHLPRIIVWCIIFQQFVVWWWMLFICISFIISKYMAIYLFIAIVISKHKKIPLYYEVIWNKYVMRKCISLPCFYRSPHIYMYVYIQIYSKYKYLPYWNNTTILGGHPNLLMIKMWHHWLQKMIIWLRYYVWCVRKINGYLIQRPPSIGNRKGVIGLLLIHLLTGFTSYCFHHTSVGHGRYILHNTCYVNHSFTIMFYEASIFYLLYCITCPTMPMFQST